MDSSKSVGDRLMITRMILENFKSYAGVQEIGPFHKRFSSIVGPNGSGKSNVIDALLFVFGKRAKQLRLNKVSELIHKSAAFPNLDYARVEIHFQRIRDIEKSDDEYETVPGSEFIVARTAFQNNQSKYTVDGKNSTYTDVGILLRQHGVDLDNNRFLILQGEVEQIAMMKPKGQNEHDEGLLEYLEDIIGSKRYIADIETAAKRVEELNEQRGEQVKKVKRSEKERDALQGPRDEAESFLTKEREIRCKQNLLYQIQSSDARNKGQEAVSRLAQCEEKIVLERSELVKKESGLVQMEAEYGQVFQEHEKLALDFQRKSEDYNRYQSELVQVTGDLEHNGKQLKKLSTTVAVEQKKEDTAVSESRQAEETITVKTEEIATLEVQKAELDAALEKEMGGLQESSRELREQLEVKQQALAVANRSVASLSTKKEQQETSLALVRNRSTAARTELERAEQAVTGAQTEIGALKARLKECATKKKKATVEKEEADVELTAVSVQETDLQAKVRKAAEASEECRSALQRSRGRSNVLSALLQSARRGGPLAGAGIRGRLGDLGAIDPKYDVAICASTSMLDSVVVETVAGAEACMAFLRENDIGRANFVALEKLDDFRRKLGVKFDAVKGAPRLIDLIDTESDLRAAFYRAVGDTLVASDLTAAAEIAYRGEGGLAVHRVVTLDGNLIETSGTMTGGGAARAGATSGMRSSKNTAAEVSEEDRVNMEKEENSLKEKLSQTRQKKSALQSKLEGLIALLSSLSNEMEEGQIKVQSLEQRTEALASSLPDLRRSIALTGDENAQIASLEAAIADTDREIDITAPDLKTLTQEVKRLQASIKEVGGPKIRQMRSKIESVTASIDESQKELTCAEVKVKECRKQITKAAAARGKADKEIQKLEEKVAQLQLKKLELDERADSLLDAQRTAKVLAEEQEGRMKTMLAAFEVVKAETEAVRDTIGTLEKSKKEAEDMIKQSKKECDQLAHLLKRLNEKHAQEARDWGTPSPSQMVGEETGAEESQNANAGDGDAMDVEVKSEELDLLGNCGKKDNWNILYDYSDEKLKSFTSTKTVKNLAAAIASAEEQCKKLKGTVDMRALIQYRERDEEYHQQNGVLSSITATRDEQKTIYEDLRRRRLEEFMTGFGVITLKLKEMYQMITLGGDAELELVDSLDPFAEGIVFSVRPPKKSWKNISNLSGGEKTLSSLALVFALHHYRPTPLYVMDEIDAALDFKNVSIVANYIKERTRDAQFVIISLRNNMFELADRLVGIYKTHDATKSVTINPRMFNDVLSSKTAGAETGPEINTNNQMPIRAVLADTTNKLNVETF